MGPLSTENRLQDSQVLTDGAEIQLGGEIKLVFSQPQTGVQYLQQDNSGKTMMESDLTAGAVQASIAKHSSQFARYDCRTGDEEIHAFQGSH